MPNNKMDHYTGRALRVMGLAQEAAEQLHHTYIGTEHLLLGMIREGGGVAARVLRDLKLELPRVEKLVDELSSASIRSADTALELSPRLKHVLELAVDEARRMGHHYMGTEHLLLAMVREIGNTATEILTRCNITPAEVRRQTRRVLQESPLAGSPPAFVEAPPQPARISAAKNPTLQLTVTDTQTGTVKFDLTLPLTQMETLSNAIHFLIDKGENGKAIVEDKDHAQRIEITLKSDAKQSKSGDSDAD